ncbi:MAG: hypothetical protein ACE5FB_03055 [Candidatus Binatia bacterium]
MTQALGLIEWLRVTWFCEDAEKHELEDQVVPFRGIGSLVASVSFSPTGGKMVLGPKKDEVRCIDCVPVKDYSDWDTYCLVQLDHIGGPELLIVRQQDLEKPTIH